MNFHSTFKITEPNLRKHHVRITHTHTRARAHIFPQNEFHFIPCLPGAKKSRYNYSRRWNQANLVPFPRIYRSFFSRCEHRSHCSAGIVKSTLVEIRRIHVRSAARNICFGIRVEHGRSGLAGPSAGFQLTGNFARSRHTRGLVGYRPARV